MTFVRLFFLWSTSIMQLCSLTGVLAITIIQTSQKYDWGFYYFFLKLGYSGIFWWTLHSACYSLVFLSLETNYSFLFSSAHLLLQRFILSHRYHSSTQNRLAYTPRWTSTKVLNRLWYFYLYYSHTFFLQHWLWLGPGLFNISSEVILFNIYRPERNTKENLRRRPAPTRFASRPSKRSIKVRVQVLAGT